MYIRLKDQRGIINQAVQRAGSYRKLSKILKIPLSSICGYWNGSVMPKSRFDKVINFLGINQKNLSIEELPKNWKQVLGGKNCVKSKRKKGTFETQLKRAQKNGALKLKEWHKIMKENNPKKYHLIQYSRFRKIGGYKYKTKKGEKVRNIFEKQVADILNKCEVKYEYEPLINIERRYFFPDFLINKKIIIECTMWKGETKAYKLKEKIDILKKKYKIFVVIPKGLYSYYKILDKYLIKGLDEFVPVAQTFRAIKSKERSNR
ncbi:MAG TPA: hypothetical protein ENG87_02345 [Candidatus Pacearchaeota archaeon]|nr:hypothetical protein BMS3Abin17_00283 [archaeon BMS3Abin17]HDK42195.1 hypothetical protein [Candidatus Pacearchaeota archaeon]HDZ60364.1 hypothetical protein [Candidatus Pacearchaeota archaeon]